MATRSEQFKAEEERTKAAKKRKTAKPKAGKKTAAAPAAAKKSTKTRAERKATHALEKVAPGKRPSRKSTRKSANRAKADATFNQVEELRGTSPETRARKAKAQAGRVRGKTPQGR